MKRLLAFLAIYLPIYLFAQGFGSFSHDQPFFAGGDSDSLIEPTNYPGNVLLFDVEKSVYTTGAAITNLNDDAPYKFNLKSINSSEAPYATNNASVINGQKWAHFDGVNDHLKTNFTTKFDQRFDVFMVGVIPQPSWTNTYSVTWGAGSASVGNRITWYTAPPLWAYEVGVSAGLVIDSTNQWLVHVWSIKGTNTVYAANNSTQYPFTTALATEGLKGLNMGMGWNNIYPQKFQMAYFGVWTNLIDAQVMGIVRSLGSRYGIAGVL